MTRVQATLEEVEASISAARRYYNASVKAHRNALEVFPGPLVARLAGSAAEPYPYFETDESVRAPVDVSKHFG